MLRSIARHPVLWTLALIALGASGWLVLREVRGTPVEIVRPRRAPLVQTVVSSGRVRPERLRLSPLVAGQVTRLPVEEGQRVEEGTLLLRLDDREAQARVAEAEAALARARTQRRNLGSLQRGQAREQLESATARAQEARRDLERLESLAKDGAVSMVSLESARTARRVSDSALRDAQLQLDALDKGGTRMRSAEAEVQQAQASLALARAQLDYRLITAPAAGVVIAVAVRQGDVAQPGTAVLELAATGRTELVAELDERNLGLLKVGQPALASAEAFPEQRFDARLSFIAPAVDPTRGTVELRFAVDEPPDYLRPDMTVSVDIEVARRDAALSLPVAALRDLASDPHVLVLEQGRALRRAVQIGVSDDMRVEVRDGLDERSAVIATPSVSAGDRVHPKAGSR